MEDAPGFQVRDDLFNDGPERVDGFVAFLLVVLQFTVRGFSFRSDKTETGVSFVCDMLGHGCDIEQSGFSQGLGVVGVAGQGVRDPRQLPG